MSACPRHIDPRVCMERWAETCWSGWKTVRGLKVSWEGECCGTPESKSSPGCATADTLLSWADWWHTQTFWESEVYWRKCKSHWRKCRPKQGNPWEPHAKRWAWMHADSVSPMGCEWSLLGSGPFGYSARGARIGGRAAFWNQGSLLVKIPSVIWMCSGSPCLL